MKSCALDDGSQKHTVTKIIFDSNIYDKISVDEEVMLRISALSSSNSIRVIATPKIVDELRESPFGGLPDWFPIHPEPENVAVCGHARSGMARLGEGRVYTEHRGESSNIADAIIADSSADMADILGSEDGRLVRRLKALRTRCVGMDYASFGEWLLSKAAQDPAGDL